MQISGLAVPGRTADAATFAASASAFGLGLRLRLSLLGRATIAASGSGSAIGRASGGGLSAVGLAPPVGRSARAAATVTSRLRGAGRCGSASCNGTRSAGTLTVGGLALTAASAPSTPGSPASVIAILAGGVAAVAIIVSSFAAIIVCAGAAIVIVGLRRPYGGVPFCVRSFRVRSFRVRSFRGCLGCRADDSRLAGDGAATARAFLGRRGVRLWLRLAARVSARSATGAARVVGQSGTELIVRGSFELERLQLVTGRPLPSGRAGTTSGTLGRTRTISRHERFPKGTLSSEQAAAITRSIRQRGTKSFEAGGSGTALSEGHSSQGL